MAGIGKLVEIDVRELWKHEQYDFSKWFAKENNFESLNDTPIPALAGSATRKGWKRN